MYSTALSLLSNKNVDRYNIPLFFVHKGEVLTTGTQNTEFCGNTDYKIKYRCPTHTLPVHSVIITKYCSSQLTIRGRHGPSCLHKGS